MATILGYALPGIVMIKGRCLSEFRQVHILRVSCVFFNASEKKSFKILTHIIKLFSQQKVKWKRKCCKMFTRMKYKN